MYHNQTVVIDYGNGQHIRVPNQTVKIIEQSDVNYGIWNGYIVAAFWNNGIPNNKWHGRREVKHGGGTQVGHRADCILAKILNI